MQTQNLLNKKVWAVVGANDNPEKYGYRIYRKLKVRGYTVFAVNPTCEKVDGDKAYPDLTSLPQLPEVIDMVVSPKRGKDFIEEAARLGIENIWLQPGTYDEELLALIERLKLNALRACVLVELA